MIKFAITGWFRQPVAPREPGSLAFFSYRTSTYGGIVLGLCLLILVETPGLHLLLQTKFPLFAWILTAFSLYSLVWIVGDYHALRLFPTTVTQSEMHIKVGGRFWAQLPLTALATGSHIGERSKKDKTYLNTNFTLIHEPNVRLVFHELQTIFCIYGIKKKVKTLDLFLDEPSRLLEVLEQRCANFRVIVEERKPEPLPRPQPVLEEPKGQRYSVALFHAIQNGQINTVRVLLSGHVDLEAEDETGKTALMWAEELGHEKIAALLRQPRA